MSDKRKRIALLMGQADEEYQNAFLNGFIRNIKAAGLGVCVFTMNKEYQNTTQREKGDSSIFGVVNFELFDGVVVLADTIQTSDLLRRLEERIYHEFSGSVFFVDGESQYFSTLWTDSDGPMKALVSWLIEKCGYKDFAFLNGKKWHRHSVQRLASFRECLIEHGLTVREDRIYDGDFWYSSGVLLARKFAEQRDDLPEIVVCANDVMAIGLCAELTAQGFDIPGDIAVAGFDSCYEGRRSPKALTSAFLAPFECGAFAADSIVRLMNGNTPEEGYQAAPKLFKGETVRRLDDDQMEDRSADRRHGWATIDSAMSYSSVHNTFDLDILNQFDLNSFLSTLFDYVCQMPAVRCFHLMLDSRWVSKNIAKDIPLWSELSREVIPAIEYNSEDSTKNSVDLTKRFDRSALLPGFSDYMGEPMAAFFTPLFFEERCFGYAEISFKEGSHGYAALDNAESYHGYDTEFALWICAVSRGLEGLLRMFNLTETARQLGETTEAVRKKERENRKYSELSQEEKKEYREVQKILDQNLFHYFFQPIVSAMDGEIYSYEALMRAQSALPINPLKVIHYADLAGRLNDVERATFLNVLGMVEKEPFLKERQVFINSIPGTRLSNVDEGKIERLLKKHSDHVVVEFTESSELNDQELAELKDKYRQLGAGIALDDYGTGYSNVSNLLRYMPDIVKIDRSLLSNIENSQQKQHFVREIIDFCHENGIKALAEGVETSEELRIVIGFGADLIQGYYTARPAPEVIASISDEIRREIRHYQQERQDGAVQSVYVAGKTNRVLLSNLVREGHNTILIGHDRMTYRDVTFIGTPGQSTNIHIEIAKGYAGTIVLDNARLSNVKSRPCIDVPAGASLTVILNGDNSLEGGGILVEEGGELRLEGEGELRIRLDAQEYYGIGSSIKSRHGKLIFSQKGEISIDATGHTGVAIGSGLGGEIELNHGRYRIRQAGFAGVSIGSFEGDENFYISGSDVAVDVTLSDYVGFGSMNGSVDVKVEHSLINCYANAKKMAGFGTLTGEKAKIVIHDANVRMDLKADESTGAGSLTGETHLSIDHGGMRIVSEGDATLAFGGHNEETHIDLNFADTKVDIRTGENTDTHAKPENFTITKGRSSFYVNGEEIERDSNSGSTDGEP